MNSVGADKEVGTGSCGICEVDSDMVMKVLLEKVSRYFGIEILNANLNPHASFPRPQPRSTPVLNRLLQNVEQLRPSTGSQPHTPFVRMRNRNNLSAVIKPPTTQKLRGTSNGIQTIAQSDVVDELRSAWSTTDASTDFFVLRCLFIDVDLEVGIDLGAVVVDCKGAI